ncbi:S-layer homology domain-containing protein [Lysinibacillus sp. NPDC047702]|uniref:S-layer homology domain-containing protein n=1 Tax=unclassified Lysinibacillus TaxID=2636778 RepID=UPI003D04CA79
MKVITRIIALTVSFFLVLQLLNTNQVRAETIVTKTPVEDGTWDKSGKYTDLTENYVGYSADSQYGIQKSALRFNFTDIQDHIKKATLRIHIQSVQDLNPNDSFYPHVSLYGSSVSDWNSWNTQNPNKVPLQLNDPILYEKDTSLVTNTWKNFDVTDFVKSQSNKIVTFVLRSEEIMPGVMFIYESRNSFTPALYPQLVLETVSGYTMTYNSNGGTGGSVPLDSNSYMSGDAVTVKGNTGGLAKTGYTFSGWNTASDGNGMNYLENYTFAIGSADVMLYAKWVELTNAKTPSIDIQPTDKTVNMGDSTTLSVAASGGASLSYQWYSNTTNSTSGGTLINGATSPMYAVSTNTAGTTYYYSIVTNTDNNATGSKTATTTSSVAKVQVNALTHAATPTIDTQPIDKTVNVGESATLSVAASGGASLSYQWYQNTTNSTSGGTLITGATSPTYAVPTNIVGTTYYYSIVTNTDNSATGSKTATTTSSVAKVQVNALTHAATPNIDTQPTDKTVNVGESATLSVAASGGASLSYQWYSNTTNSTSGGTLINGATSPMYAVSTNTAGTTYYYSIVTNTDNSATGSKTATTTSSVAKVQVNALTHAATPTIDTQPIDKTVNVGESATLSVAASGGASLSYQWYSNTTNSTSGGTLINGATSPMYAVPTNTEGTTYYYSIVTNTDNSATGSKTATATSSVAKVQVNALTHAATPTIDTQPTDKTVNVGESATLSVAASGGASLSYQWYQNTTNSTSGGTLITGATSPTYTVSTNTEGTTYYYSIVTNTDNSATGSKTATATSSVAKVQVNALTHAATPTIDTQPIDKTVNVGDSMTLSVAASGGASLSYQWYSNTTNSTSGGTLITGATSPTYAVSTNTAGTTYYYSIVTNTDNSATGSKTAIATSSVAKVEVNALIHAATPTIDTQPTDKTVNVGDSAMINVSASGGASLSYQWYSNTTNSTSKGTLINGATSPMYAVPTNTAGTTYYYSIVTNMDNSATGSKIATATSSVAKVQVKLANPQTSGSGTTSSNDNNLSPAPVKITLHTNGGTTLAPIEIAYNTKISQLPVPAREGFRFDGWYQDAEFTKPWEKEMLVRENIALYAKWTALLVKESEKPQEPQEPQLPKPVVTYGDLSHHWAKEMVEELATLGIIQGYEDGTFRPNAPISRMHVAALLTRAFPFEPVRAVYNFSDVSSTHPYYDAIITLQQAGIIDGTNGAFLPTEKMTRAQLAKVLVGVLGLTPEGASSFTDVDSQHWSAGYIAVLEREGIALGDNGKFRPNEVVTRAQFAAFLHRIMQQ